jgi:hypothetical protein
MKTEILSAVYWQVAARFGLNKAILWYKTIKYFDQIEYNKVPSKATEILYSPTPLFIFALLGNDH